MNDFVERLRTANADLAAGRLAEAEKRFRALHAEQPENPRLLYMLGVVARAARRPADAVGHLEAGLRLAPDDDGLLIMLAGCRAELGEHEEAARLLDRVIEADPGHIEALRVLGDVRAAGGDAQGARDAYERALAAGGTNPTLEAHAARMLAAEGRPAEAVERARHAAAAAPTDPAVQLEYANVLKSARRHADARKVLERVLATSPESLSARGLYISVLRALNKLDEAAEQARRLAADAPNDSGAHVALGLVEMSAGRMAAARQSMERAVALDPGNDLAELNLNFLMLYDERPSRQDIGAAHRRWAIHHADRLGVGAPAFDNDPDPERRLRVGLVSSDFRVHSVAYFVEPLLTHLDRTRVEIHCFDNGANPDTMTDRLRGLADHWHIIAGLDDRTAAAKVRTLGIDILIDLNGRTRGHRMYLFARRAAPIQLTYLGYPAGTGLAAMDYRLTDSIIDPPQEPAHAYCETLVRLDPCFMCYKPPTEAPPVGPAAAEQNGRITFGSFNNIMKISDATVRVWTKVLSAAPDSRLVLKFGFLAAPGVRADLLDRFGAAGADSARIELRSAAPALADHLAAYNDIDIALDTLPYNGATTTCEALWMGVPLVTMAGRCGHARVGASLLNAAGLKDLVAGSEADFVSRAVALAEDSERRRTLRATMRERLSRSALLDGAAFARRFEAELRQCWRSWGLKRREDSGTHSDRLRRIQELCLTNKFTEAENLARLAVAETPGNMRALYLLAYALYRLNRHDAALEIIDRVVAHDPKRPDGRGLRGQILLQLNRNEEALVDLETALDQGRDDVALTTALGIVRRRTGLIEEAIAAYDLALAADPDFAPAHLNRGAALLRINRVEEAIDDYERAIALEPNDPSAHFNRGLARLLLGRFEEGWLDYEWRHRRPQTPLAHADHPTWRGDALAKRSLLVHMEQGYGDAIQFVRYVPRIVKNGGRILIECRKPLARLLETVEGVDEVHIRGNPLPHFDAHIPVASLPYRFGTTAETIPADIPYLSAPSESAVALPVRERAVRVGLAWAGSPTHAYDDERSLPADAIRPLLATAGVAFFSLQIGRAEGLAEEMACGSLIDLAPQLHDFGATAAAIIELDLIISADTAVAHLAGALGRPVWTLIPFAPDWRWGLYRNDCPWYPTMRLFRQQTRGSWQPTISEVAAALTRLVAER